MIDDLFSPVTRRGFVGAAAVAGLALAGCGSSSVNSSASSAAAATGPRKRGGTLRFAGSDVGGTTSTDPTYSQVSWSIVGAMYDSLLRIDHQLNVHPALADEFAPEGNDLQTWNIRLRPGVEFHNGKTVTADDVVFTIRRLADPKTPSFIYGLMDPVDPANGIKKLDERTVRLHLKYPNSQMMTAFWQFPAAILPVGFDPKNPAGTGPFKQTSFTPEQRWTGVRNDNYWMSGQPYLDGMEILGFANPDTARFNALLSGQADAMDHLLPAQIPQLKSRSDLALVVSETGAFEQTAMNNRKGAQFEDPRVRMAFKLMVNRPQMIEEVYGGYGAIGNDTGTWPQFDPAYDASLSQRVQDVEQARSLLKSAGKAGMTVTYRVGEVVPGVLEAADLMIQYGKAIGVTINLEVVSDLAQFYGSAEYETAQLKNDYDDTQTMYENAAYCWLPGSLYNNTGYNNPQVNSLYRQALASTGAKYTELIHEMSRVIWDDGPWIVWGRRNVPDAHSTKFTGFEPDAYGQGLNGYHWNDVSLA
jgi:peptide/nickel transport system substrate-binding protein